MTLQRQWQRHALALVEQASPLEGEFPEPVIVLVNREQIIKELRHLAQRVEQ